MDSWTAVVRGTEGGKKGGPIGGRSRSQAKQRAARANGAKGGRPRLRTLGEALLRQPIDRKDYHTLKLAFVWLDQLEREKFLTHCFGPKDFWKATLGRRAEEFSFNRTDYRQRVYAPPRRTAVALILKKVRLSLRYLLAQ